MKPVQHKTNPMIRRCSEGKEGDVCVMVKLVGILNTRLPGFTTIVNWDDTATYNWWLGDGHESIFIGIYISIRFGFLWNGIDDHNPYPIYHKPLREAEVSILELNAYCTVYQNQTRALKSHWLQGCATWMYSGAIEIDVREPPTCCIESSLCLRFLFFCFNIF